MEYLIVIALGLAVYSFGALVILRLLLWERSLDLEEEQKEDLLSLAQKDDIFAAVLWPIYLLLVLFFLTLIGMDSIVTGCVKLVRSFLKRS